MPQKISTTETFILMLSAFLAAERVRNSRISSESTRLSSALWWGQMSSALWAKMLPLSYISEAVHFVCCLTYSLRRTAL